MDGVDRLDRKILAALQGDGRITNADLAERIGLSATATADRVRRLTRDGFIRGYRAELDPGKLGRGLLVFVEVLLDRTSPDVFDAFATQVKRAGEVLECHMVAGGFDYLLKARVRDMGAYRRFLAEVILPLPGVRETRTYAVMEEVKATTALPI
ncbi:winged helix-turn-helix transcriptional regulator [Siculibacillus lacustris]|uniref:Winged helix-turn-helix transcriptional regulator n=1 Tax=Siculibacillus lacustris TaxID=1549641 RepID=A0A4V2KTZ3_9HYPH|nr:Lrp/AsnC ligand binding domain-containing protein [Siculibacillus lacustris]TBW39305.1 winged helix-turn-helix transcriptional regulator [Siculibacillus lacustris]